MAEGEALAMNRTDSAVMRDASGLPIPSLSVNPEAIFSHPDRTDMIDGLNDPLREMATAFHAQAPVIKGHGIGTPRGSQVRFGDYVLPNILLTAKACEGDVYAAVTWDAVRTLYTRPKLFSSRCFVDSLGLQGPTLTTMDPPEHSKYRMVAQPGFTPAHVMRFETEVIRPVIARRFTDLRGKGRAELVRDLTTGIAFEINGSFIGFSREDVTFITSCKKMAFSHDREAVAKASAAQYAFALNLIAERRAHPRDDLISFMARQQVDGAPVSDRNLVGIVNVVLAGGVDTIYKQSGNIVAMLLHNPAQLEILRGDRSLIPAFVAESLRYDGVATHFPRMATEDTVLEGVDIPRGGIIFGMIFAANRDPARWTDPHELDVTRAPKANMSFSAGPHACIGAPIARMALQCFTEHLLDDLPGLRWDPAQPTPRITGWTQRMALSLPVLWDPA